MKTAFASRVVKSYTGSLLPGYPTGTRVPAAALLETCVDQWLLASVSGSVVKPVCQPVGCLFTRYSRLSNWLYNETMKRWKIFTCARKLANSQLNLPHGRNQTKKTNEETENKNRDAQKKRTSHKAVESVVRPEGSLWWERFEAVSCKRANSEHTARAGLYTACMKYRRVDVT